MEFTLLWAALVAAVAFYGVVRWEARRGNAADCSRDVWDTAIAAALAGLLTGRLAAMILAGTNPLARPGDILVVRGGVDTVWASVGALITFAVLARRELAALADAGAAAALAGLAGWHAGCLFRDACLGTPSDLPWAYALPGSDITRHPVELYAAGLFLLAAGAALAARRRSLPPGALAAAALAAAAAARLVTEPFRPTLGASLAPWYAAGALAGLAAAAALTRRRRAGRARPRSGESAPGPPPGASSPQ